MSREAAGATVIVTETCMWLSDVIDSQRQLALLSSTREVMENTFFGVRAPHPIHYSQVQWRDPPLMLPQRRSADGLLYWRPETRCNASKGELHPTREVT